LLLLSALSLAACAHTPPPERIQAVASAAPPPPRREAAGEAPHPGWSWIAGYWNRVMERYVWVPGFWALPPSGFSSWEAAHWVHDASRGWLLVRGRWR
jgi:hypothetical protein